MKKLLLLALLALSFNLSAQDNQWIHESVEDEFNDKPAYSAIYNLDRHVEGIIYFPSDKKIKLIVGYVCDDSPPVLISIKYADGTKKLLKTSKSIVVKNSNVYITDPSFVNNVIEEFKKGSSVSIKITESHCDDDFIRMSLSGFTSAFNKIK